MRTLIRFGIAEHDSGNRRYNAMDPRKLGIESDALSTLHGMLGEISSIARASGITTLRNEVAASAAHVSSGNTEFRASAVKVSGPKWDGRDKTPSTATVTVSQRNELSDPTMDPAIQIVAQEKGEAPSVARHNTTHNTQQHQPVTSTYPKAV